MRDKNTSQNRIWKAILLSAVILALIFAVLAYLKKPQINVRVDRGQGFEFAGELKDYEGNCLPDGEYEVVFRVFEQEFGGYPLWQEQQLIPLYDCRFETLLGQDGSMDFDLNSGEYYLEVKLLDSDEGGARYIVTEGDGSIDITETATGDIYNSYYSTTYTTGTGQTLDGVVANGNTTQRAVLLNGQVTLEYVPVSISQTNLNTFPAGERGIFDALTYLQNLIGPSATLAGMWDDSGTALQPKVGGSQNVAIGEGWLSVSGATTLSSTLNVSNEAWFADKVSVSKRVTFGSGSTYYYFPTTRGSNNQVLVTDGNGSLSWADQSGSGGSTLWTDTGTALQPATGVSGNINIASGTLTVFGATTLSSTLDVTGVSTFASTIAVTGTSNFIGAVTHNSGANTYVFPTIRGSADQILVTDVSGNITWANQGSGFADPMTTRGDIIFRDATNTTTRLGAGGANQVLTSDGTDIAWGDPAWVASGGVTSLFDSTDNVTVGSSSNLAKLAVDGDAEEVQFLVQGNATQTNNLVVFENSTGSDLFTMTGTGVTTFVGNVNTTDGLDITGGAFTFTGTAGSWTIAEVNSALTQTGTGLVTFSGNVDANSGLDVTGAAFTVTGQAITQTVGQVTFGGNVDATSGIDVTGANLTVGGANFTVTTAGVVTAAGLVNANLGLSITNAALTMGTQSITGVGTNITATGALTITVTGANNLSFIAQGGAATAFNSAADPVLVGFGAVNNIIGALNALAAGSAGLWTDAGAYIYPTNTGTGFKIYDAGSLEVDGDLTFIGAQTISNTTGDLGITSTDGSINVTLGGGAGDVFNVDSDTLVVESENNRVGIGTAAPSYRFHLDDDTNQSNLDRAAYIDYESTYAAGTTHSLFVNNQSTTGFDQNHVGVWGQTVGSILASEGLNIGVYGYATGNTGGNIGIYGKVEGDSQPNTGGYFYVSGNSPSKVKMGLYSEVVGTALNNYGLRVTASGGTTNYGIDVTGSTYGIYINSGASTDELYVAGTANFTGNVDAEAGIDITNAALVMGSQSITEIGSNIIAAGATTLSNVSGALTITAAAASTWSTSIGLLTVQGAAGVTVDANAGALTLDAATGNDVIVTLGGVAGDDFIVNGTTLVIESDTNQVGINVADPTVDLHVVGDTYITNGLGVGIVQTTTGYIQANTRIGVAGVPAYPLDVTGQAYITTELGVGGLPNASYGVYANNSGENVRAVYGLADGSSGTNYGLYGVADRAPTGYGVYGKGTRGTTNYGVYGIAGGTSTSYGIYGTISDSSGTNYAGYFDGSGASVEYGVYINGGTTDALYVSGTGHVTGTIFAVSGIYIGAEADANLIDDSTHGAGSTTLYIGNRTIDTSASDRRLKKNITPSTLEALDLLMSMEIKDFDWNTDDGRSAEGRMTGLIAQELYEYLPQMVHKPDDSNNTWSVRYNSLVPYVIKAVQMQQAQIEELQVSGDTECISRDIDSLENRIGTLESQIGKHINTLSFLTDRIAALENQDPISPPPLSDGIPNLIEGDFSITGDLDVTGTIKTSSIWSQNATWHLDSQGELFVQNIQSQDIELAEGDNKAVGSGNIPVGQSEIIVANTSVTENSYILITIGGHAQANASAAISDNLKIKQIDAGQSFVVSTIDNEPTTEEIPFGYLVVN